MSTNESQEEPRSYAILERFCIAGIYISTICLILGILIGVLVPMLSTNKEAKNEGLQISISIASGSTSVLIPCCAGLIFIDLARNIRKQISQTAQILAHLAELNAHLAELNPKEQERQEAEAFRLKQEREARQAAQQAAWEAQLQAQI